MIAQEPRLSVVAPEKTAHAPNPEQAAVLAKERRLIGQVLFKPTIFVTLGITAAIFLPGPYRWIWEAMERLVARGDVIDDLLVYAELERMGMDKARAVGGPSDLAEMSREVETADNAHFYADSLRAAYGRRKAVEAMEMAIRLSHRGDDPDDIRRHVIAADVALESANGPRYSSAPSRLKGDREKRIAIGKSLQKYRLPFLDDYLRGIAPGDLTLIGASTGVGKTEIAARIAQANAANGKRVYMLALEAQENEIERRIMYNMLAKAVFGDTPDGRPWLDKEARSRMNYMDWSLGFLDDIVGEFEPIIEGKIRQTLPTLNTLYRDRDFDVGDLEKRLGELQGKADLVILDHLHYVDSKDENENRAAKRIMQVIRTANQKTGVPAIVVAHLRKRGTGKSSLIPDLDDFHGSSEITKIATAAVMVSRATDNPNQNDWVANTYISIPKARGPGRCPYVALVGYDIRRNEYGKGYQLGKVSFDGSAVELLDPRDRQKPYPQWAKNAG